MQLASTALAHYHVGMSYHISCGWSDDRRGMKRLNRRGAVRLHLRRSRTRLDISSTVDFL
jgi:hypothetical protein